MVSIVIGTAQKRNKYLVDKDSIINDLVNEYMPGAVGRLYLNQEPVEDVYLRLSDYDLGEVNTLISITDKNAGYTARIDGNNLKVISTLSLDDMRKLEKFRKDDLSSEDYPPDLGVSERTRVGVALIEGEMNAQSISFNPTPTASGKAWVSVQLPELDNAKQYVIEEYGEVLTHLGYIEERSEDWLKSINDKLAQLGNNITIMED